MHRWNSSYDSHSREVSSTSHSYGIAQPRKARFHQNPPQIGKVTLLPAFVEESRYYRSGQGDEDDFEREENELFYVSQKVNEENYARQYSPSNYLAPPHPRSQNETHDRGRQRIRRYEVDPIRGGQPLHSEQHDTRPSLSRSASLPAVQSPSRPSRTEDLQATPKARKTRPTPLDLPPPLHLPYNAEDSTPISPYPLSILALYSPSQPLSPNSRTRSLPPYSFQASDFPPPEEAHLSSHSFQFSPQLSSSSSSFLSPRASSVSSESSMSSFRPDSEGQYAMPTPPLPSAGASRKQRIHNQISPNVMSREHLFPRYI